MIHLHTRCLVSLLLAGSLSGQMAGTYSIDPNGMGSRNFSTFSAAFVSMRSVGVKAPVVFEVMPGAYVETFTSSFISGSSATNTITFRSAMPQAAILIGNRGIFMSTVGFKGLILDGFIVSGVGWSGHSLDLWGEELEIRNCVFRSASIRYRGNLGEIHHNRFRAGEEAIDYVGNRARIHHNEFALNPDGPANTALLTSGRTAGRHKIYNNLFWGPFGSSKPIVYLIGAMDFVHNTIVTFKHPGTHAARLIHLDGSVTGQIRMRHNIVVDFNGDTLVQASGGFGVMDIGQNLFFAPNSSALFSDLRSGGLRYYTLRSWRLATGLEKESVYADPEFLNSNLPALDTRLRDSSAAIGLATDTQSFVIDDFGGANRHDPASVGAYEGAPRAEFEEFGKGCAGTFSNVPKIGHSGPLTLGTTKFSVTLDNARGGTGVVAFFIVGGSNTSWNGVSLPLKFGGSCDLLVSANILIPVSVGGTSGPGNGNASVRLPIPDSPGLAGAQAFFQWGVLDPAAAGIGVAFSDGAVLSL